MDECKPLAYGKLWVGWGNPVLAAGPYTRPLFGSTEALSVGLGVHIGLF